MMGRRPGHNPPNPHRPLDDPRYEHGESNLRYIEGVIRSATLMVTTFHQVREGERTYLYQSEVDAVNQAMTVFHDALKHIRIQPDPLVQ